MTRPDNYAVLEVRVHPRASIDQIDEIMPDGRLKIRIKAPPVDGKANLSLVTLLATVLDVRKSQIQIESGAASRDKRILVLGKSQAEVDRLVRLAF